MALPKLAWLPTSVFIDLDPPRTGDKPYVGRVQTFHLNNGQLVVHAASSQIAPDRTCRCVEMEWWGGLFEVISHRASHHNYAHAHQALQDMALWEMIYESRSM